MSEKDKIKDDDTFIITDEEGNETYYTFLADIEYKQKTYAVLESRNEEDYFDDEEEDETPVVKSPSRVKPAARKKAEKNYSIPVDVKGSSNRTWNIPEE